MSKPAHAERLEALVEQVISNMESRLADKIASRPESATASDLRIVALRIDDLDAATLGELRRITIGPAK